MLKIVADSFPYARYMSYQTYDLTTLTALKSLRDVDIVPDNGPNLYNNLTAAARGEKQGDCAPHVVDQRYVVCGCRGPVRRAPCARGRAQT
jgi:hypothetical protein